MNKKIVISGLVVLAFLLGVSLASAVSDTVYVGDYRIDYSYNNVEEGEDFTLSVTLTNEDNENKTDITFELDSTNPFDVEGDDEWDIAELAPDASRSETFRIEVDKNTKKGTYDLEFTLEDDDDDFDDEFEIEVESDKAEFVVGDITSLPTTLLPNQEEVKLEISLENIGGGDAEFVKAKLELPNGFVGASSFSLQTNLGTIEEGENKVAIFYFDTLKELNSGTKSAQLVLDYESNGNSESETLEVQLPVKATPLFSVVSTQTTPTNLQIGTKDNSIQITIQNIGEETGEETSIRVFENTDMPFEFNEKTNFIGDIAPGRSGSAVFSFELDSGFSAKTYLLNIQTRTVTREDVLIEEYTVPVSVGASQNSGISPLFILALLVVAVGIVIGVVARSKRKRK